MKALTMSRTRQLIEQKQKELLRQNCFCKHLELLL